MYGVVTSIPLTQYEVIFQALKQLRFYKSFRKLFPADNFLWDDVFAMLKKYFFNHHRFLDANKINATVLVTDGPMAKPQLPHMDNSWETILLLSQHESQQNRSKYLRGSCQIPFTGIFLCPPMVLIFISGLDLVLEFLIIYHMGKC